MGLVTAQYDNRFIICRFRLLTWFVFFSLLQTLVLPQSFAKSDSVLSPEALKFSKAQKNKKFETALPIVVSLEVTSSTIALSSLKEISEELRSELKNSKKALVYSRQEMQQALNHTLNEEKVAARQIDEFVNNARKLYDDFKFKAAAQVMGEAMKVVPFFDATPPILHNISEAYLTEALIFFALEKEDEAKVSFLNAAALEPTRVLDPLLYPPSVIEKFDRAKKEFTHIREGSLRIESDPPVAEVYVEGKRQGTTPLTLKDLPLGVQKIRIVKEGYDAWEKHLMIVSKGSNQYSNRVGVNLNKMGSNVSLNVLMGELISRKTLELQLSKMADLGKLFYADLVYASRIEKSKNEKGYDFFLAVVDVKSGSVIGKSYAPIAQNLSDLHLAITTALQAISRHFPPEKFTDLIAVEPKGANYVASYHKKKPFYKRWYFYVPLGVVVAGGGAGAAIFLSHSSGPSGGAVASGSVVGP